MYQKKLTCVIGDPVDENPTVVIAEAAYDAQKLPWQYLTIQVKRGNLAAAVNGMKAMGFAGFNVTMPFKQEILEHLDELSPAARFIGAVNAVANRDGKLFGDNTDGKGFLAALRERGISVEGKKIVLLGTGGAARAIAVELVMAGAASLVIAGRTEEKGRSLAALIDGAYPNRAAFSLWQGRLEIPEDADILINATSIGFENPDAVPDVDCDAIRSNLVVCDVIPNNEHTLFLRNAERKGCQTLGGLSMILHSVALSYEIFTGRDAPLDVMKKALQEVYRNY